MPRRIVIIGCGVSGTTAAFQARKTDRTAQIVLLGDEELAEYYSLCDVFLLPNREMPDGDTE